jgi:hypothetical protein
VYEDWLDATVARDGIETPVKDLEACTSMLMMSQPCSVAKRLLETP